MSLKKVISKSDISKYARLKKYLWRGFLIFWVIIGILISIWTILIFIKTQSMRDLGGVLVGALLLALGVYALFIYIGLTLLIFLIRFVMRIIRKKRKSKIGH